MTRADQMAAAAYLPVGADFVPPPEVAPGVLAFVSEVAGAIVVPFVYATNPGNGDVGRWLDGLPRDRTVIFIEVLSERFAGMLQRRGFVNGRLRIGDETADVMLRHGGEVPATAKLALPNDCA